MVAISLFDKTATDAGPISPRWISTVGVFPVPTNIVRHADDWKESRLLAASYAVLSSTFLSRIYTRLTLSVINYRLFEGTDIATAIVILDSQERIPRCYQRLFLLRG